MTYDPNMDQESESFSDWQQESPEAQAIPEQPPEQFDPAEAETPILGDQGEAAIPEQLPEREYTDFQEPDPLSQEQLPLTQNEDSSGVAPEPFSEEPVQQSDFQAEYPQEPQQEEPQSEEPEPYVGRFGAQEPAAEPEKRRPRRRAIKKGRPRRKNGEGLLGIPNILVTLVWCALTLLISITLGRMVWVCAAEVLAFGREDKVVTITITEEDTIDDITQKLVRAELIHYPGLFKLYAQFAVDEGEIRPGIWDLNTKYDYHALVRMMSPSSTKEIVKVMIPEGYSCRQIFALLEENRVCTVKDMETYAATGELNDYWFLGEVTRGDKYCLEGFLFPDTYEFYKNDTPKSVLTKMLNNFDKRFTENLDGKLQALNNHLTDLMRRDGQGQDYINSHLFTVRDVVNVASMIEKETSSAEEGYTIASVIYNRLFCWHGTPAYLNIDATIVYALNGKTDLTAEDLKVASPYNTYYNIGLTPGPIANPGLSSLKAALEPADTNYYYYVLDPEAGSHVFATTQEEHDANRARLGG